MRRAISRLPYLKAIAVARRHVTMSNYYNIHDPCFRILPKHLCISSVMDPLCLFFPTIFSALSIADVILHWSIHFFCNPPLINVLTFDKIQPGSILVSLCASRLFHSIGHLLTLIGTQYMYWITLLTSNFCHPFRFLEQIFYWLDFPRSKLRENISYARNQIKF